MGSEEHVRTLFADRLDSLADDPERAAELDRAFLEFATRSNRGVPDGPVEYPFEYLLVIARMPNA